MNDAQFDNEEDPFEHLDASAFGEDATGEFPVHTDQRTGRPRYPWTDVGNAERLRDEFGDVFRYVGVWRRFIVFDGKRWNPDTDLQIFTLAKRVVRGMWAQAEWYDDDSERAKFTTFVKSSESAARIRAMIDLVKSDRPIGPTELDRDPMLLNVSNGTIDLRTGELRTHNANDFLTKIAPVAFNPDAPRHEWRKFLESTFGEQDVVDFLQRLCGYCLTADVSEHILPIFWGSGSNGKSTFVEAYMHVLGGDGDGSYALKAPHDFLLKTKGDRHPTEIADLHGKRFVAAVETGQGRRLNESLAKELTGGDTLRGRGMKQDFWSFRATHKLTISTNHRPTVHGTDNGIWRRLLLVPFTRTFGEDEKDPKLPQKLRAEAAGILAWAVEGCREWLRQGLSPPQSVLAATAEYRTDEDVIGEFLVERCVRESGTMVRAKDLFDAFKEWCDRNGYGTNGRMSAKAFGSEIRARGYETKRSNGIHYLGLGIEWKDEG